MTKTGRAVPDAAIDEAAKAARRVVEAVNRGDTT
jgi:hypothetical protein